MTSPRSSPSREWGLGGGAPQRGPGGQEPRGVREGEIRGAPPHLGAWQHHGHPPPRGGDWVGGHPEEDPGGRSPGGKQNLIGSPTPLPTKWSPAPLEGHVRKTTSLKVIGGPAPPPMRWSPAPHTRGTRPDHLLIDLSCLFFFPLLALVIVLILFVVLFRFHVHLFSLLPSLLLFSPQPV